MPQKHSLWLVPPQPQRDRLEDAIATFCQTTGLPAFTPHVTLLGDIPASADDISAALTPLTRTWKPLSLSLTETRTGADFFMSFYACVTAGPVLETLHQACCRLFPDAAVPRQFTPHISLAYGPATDADKTRFTATVAPDLPLTFPVDRVFIVRSSNETPIADWACLQSLPFGEAC